VPPAANTDTTANWAEPANVVALMTIDATGSKPAERASTPKDAPNRNTAGESGRIARAPAA
jgi:hypothetical protein